MKAEKRFMGKAIMKALEGMTKGNSPFGSCIVKGGTVVAVAHNTVLTKKDATNHAEINAIREACRKLKTYDLRGCVIYSTTEPCPMCFSAIHWARIDGIVYGTCTNDVDKLGFGELTICDVELKREGRSGVRIKGGFMKKECMELLNTWKRKGGKTY